MIALTPGQLVTISCSGCAAERSEPGQRGSLKPQVAQASRLIFTVKKMVLDPAALVVVWAHALTNSSLGRLKTYHLDPHKKSLSLLEDECEERKSVTPAPPCPAACGGPYDGEPRRCRGT